MNRNYEDNAVSPVIATILLVAIVVVLAAVVAVVAVGMAGGQNDLKDVGLAVTSDHTDVMVTLFTGQDVRDLQSLRVSVAGNPYVNEFQSTNTTDCVRQIGVPIRFTGVGVEGTHTTTVTGVFSDTTAVTLWTGQLAFALWPADASSHKHENENMIKVTLPRDWTAGTFQGNGWQKQLVVDVSDSSGRNVVNRTWAGWELNLALSFYKDSCVIITNQANKGFAPGSYRVVVRGQTVDSTGNTIFTDSLLYDGTVVVP
ncbi:MAG TPA: type IV pilin [Methanocorpusculum sp.]|nr:type IV pilin [Methanocorpusculum sp.]HJK79377.1 type IV pilin [Methanocorpusculum sp.]